MMSKKRERGCRKEEETFYRRGVEENDFEDDEDYQFEVEAYHFAEEERQLSVHVKSFTYSL